MSPARRLRARAARHAPRADGFRRPGQTALRRAVGGAGLGVLALVATGCGPDESVSVDMATTDARAAALDDAAAIREAMRAHSGAAAVRDATDAWSRTALGRQAAIHELGGGDLELVMVYDVSENQGGGWFSSEVVVRLCTQLEVRGGDDPQVDFVGAPCPDGLPLPEDVDTFVEVTLE